MTDEVRREGGVIRGPWVRPRNISASSAGSIHEESTARALGMRGALVTGRTLLVGFVPVLLEAFGRRWFERGTISMEFRDGVLDQEELRAAMQAPPPQASDLNVRAWIERPNGVEVARGSASAGLPAEATWLGAIDPLQFDTGNYALVEDYAPGTLFPEQTVVISDAQAERWQWALPSLPWFTEPSPWGGAIASPAAATSALTAGATEFRREHPLRGVPVDGAIELRNLHGPVFLGRPYSVTSGVIGRGHSPRTEYIWYESRLAAKDGKAIAEMRMKLRFMREPARGESDTYAPLSRPDRETVGCCDRDRPGGA